jgi:hypothetical protein
MADPRTTIPWGGDRHVTGVIDVLDCGDGRGINNATTGVGPVRPTSTYVTNGGKDSRQSYKTP